MGLTADGGSREGATRLRPLFRLAAVNGLEAAVKEQLRRGADVNATDQRGCSPLILASAAGHVETCRILLEAGADLQLLDVDGNDALTLAVTHGRDEVAALLRSFLIPPTQRADLDPPERQPEQNQSTDSYELDVWEVYEEPTLPARSGEAVLADVLTLQQRLSEHVPIDHDDDWLDVDIDLPAVRDRSYRGGLDDDERDAARGIILRGLRDGCIPAWRLAALDLGGEERDEDLQVSLLITLGDLGVVIDDESSDDHDIDTSVAIEADDELVVDEALDLMSAMWSRECDPLYLYRKEIGGTDLLTREEEVELAKEMELGIEEAINALARWPKGLVNVVDILDQIRVDAKRLEDVVDCDSGEPIDSESLDEQSAEGRSVRIAQEDDRRARQWGSLGDSRASARAGGYAATPASRTWQAWKRRHTH